MERFELFLTEMEKDGVQFVQVRKRLGEEDYPESAGPVPRSYAYIISSSELMVGDLGMPT